MGCTSSVMTSKGINKFGHRIDMNSVNVPVVRGHPSNTQVGGYIFGNQIRTKLALRPIAFAAKSRTTDELVTIRQYSLTNLKNCTEEDIFAEITIHSYLTHQNVIKIMEIYSRPEAVFVVTSQQDLTRLKDINLPITPLGVKSILRGLCSAVTYCHSRGVIIRNIFPKVIMAKPNSSGDYTVKLVDFSCAVLEGSSHEFPINHLGWDVVHYTAPEALLSQPYTVSMDLWSVGVVAYEITSSCLPFHAEIDGDLIRAIKTASYSFDEANWKDKDPILMKFIEKLLVVHPMKRFFTNELAPAPMRKMSIYSK